MVLAQADSVHRHPSSFSIDFADKIRRSPKKRRDNPLETLVPLKVSVVLPALAGGLRADGLNH